MSSSIKRVLANTVYITAGRMVSLGLVFVLFVLAARRLGSDAYGVFSYAYALLGMVSIAMDMGVSRYIVQQVSREEGQAGRVLGAGLLLKGPQILVSMVIAVVVGWAMGRGPEALLAILFLGGYMAADNVTKPYLAVMQGHEHMLAQSVLSAATNTGIAVAGFVVLWVAPSTAALAAVFCGAGLLRMVAIAIWYRGRYEAPVWSIPWRECLHVLRESLPFSLVAIFVSIYYYIDTLILANYATDEVIGYYNAAYRLIEVPLFVVSSFTLAIFPAASKLYHAEPEELSRLVGQGLEKAAVLGLAVAVGGSFFAKPIMHLVFGEAYAPAAPVLSVLIWSVAIIMPSTIMGTVIRAIGRQKASAWVTGMGALLNVVLNLLIIPRWSMLGAAWTTLATEVFVVVVYAWMAWRFVGPALAPRRMLKVLGYGGAVLAVAVLTSALWLWVGLAVYGVAVVALVPALGILSLGELRGALGSLPVIRRFVR